MFFLLNRGARLTVFPFIAILITGCGTKQRSSDDAIDSTDVYSLEVRKDRKSKDLYLLTSDTSPLPDELKGSFTGLAYFKPDKSYAFETVLQRFPQPEEVVMATSKDRPRRMIRIGYLPFMIDGSEHRLHVFMPKDTSDGAYWFIPFYDKTNGESTYPGGRYIDIEDVASDTTFLDFNYAYNPYCAYNERYDCPIPPEENRLTVAIGAGEKYAGK